MAQERHKTARVQAGGRIEVFIPALADGDVVDVSVRTNGDVAAQGSARPRFGSARGLVEIAPDFDAPLDEFRDYT